MMYGTHFYRRFISKEAAPPPPVYERPKKDPFKDGKGKQIQQIKKKPPPKKEPTEESSEEETPQVV